VVIKSTIMLKMQKFDEKTKPKSRSCNGLFIRHYIAEKLLIKGKGSVIIKFSTSKIYC